MSINSDQSKLTVLCDAHQGAVSLVAVQGCPDCQQGFTTATARALALLSPPRRGNIETQRKRGRVALTTDPTDHRRD